MQAPLVYPVPRELPRPCDAPAAAENKKFMFPGEEELLPRLLGDSRADAPCPKPKTGAWYLCEN